MALIQESLSVAHKTGAIAAKDLERVAVDTTVQPKAIAHPTDARLMHRAIVKLVALARRHAEHRMDRNCLKGRDGDRSNAVLAAAGYNFSLLLRGLAALLRALIAAFSDRGTIVQAT